MKLALRWLEPQHRELLSPKQTALTDATASSSWLERLSQSIVNKLMLDSEPQVWYTCDADGKLWWNAHDSATGRSIDHLSEAEMRSWLEQRHYQVEG